VCRMSGDDSFHQTANLPALRHAHRKDRIVRCLPEKHVSSNRHPVGGRLCYSAAAGGTRSQVRGIKSTCGASWRPSGPPLATWPTSCGRRCARAAARRPAPSARIQPIPALGQSIWPARPFPLARGLAHQEPQHALPSGAFTGGKVGQRLGCVPLSFRRREGKAGPPLGRCDDHGSDSGSLRIHSLGGRRGGSVGSYSGTSHHSTALASAAEGTVHAGRSQQIGRT